MKPLDPKLIEDVAKENPEYAGQLAREYRKAMIVLARKDPSWFCAYVLKNEQDGSQIFQWPEHEAMHRKILECPRTVIWTFPSLGKALPLDTPVPGPRGWKTMGDLVVGDEVFGADGKPCTVLAATEVQHGRKVYKITFDDRTSVLADENHNWIVTTTKDRHDHAGSRVVTTAEIARGPLVHNEKRVWAIPTTAPVVYPPQDLPVHPYVLGVWLGDGESKRPWIVFHEDDAEVFLHCMEILGEECTAHPIKGRPHLFRASLGGKNTARAFAAAGLLGPKGSKFIPEAYLRGSIEQRTELLAGLLDTDGWISPEGMVEFCNTQKDLADAVAELARSLGMKVRESSKIPTCKGKPCARAYLVRFTPNQQVFRLARKAARVRLGEGRSTGRRYIDAVEEVPSVPVRCIAVSSPDHSFLIGRDYTVTHNCAVNGQRVLRADGSWVPIETLTDSTKLLTLDIATGKLVEVTGRVSDNGKKKVIGIHFSTGAHLRVTENHPILREDLQWVLAQDVQVGESYVGLQNLDLPGSTDDRDVPPEEAEILGYLLAGRIWKNGSVIVRAINASDK
ncbi:MAG: hypothetical protein E6Q97_04415, partial [Desulfurellales bacterium]